MGHYCHDGLAALADVTSAVAALAEGLVKAVAVVYTLVSFGAVAASIIVLAASWLFL